MKKAYVLLFDGYADWELGNVLAELRRFGKVEVVVVGFSEKSVVSMGGLNVRVDTVLSQVNLDDVLIFLLPGGYMWEGSYPKAEIGLFLNRLEKEKIPVAAICAATTVLARAGLFQGKKHTSNSIKYLSKMVPEYSEHKNYVNSLSTRDQHVITASGLGSLEFTMEILNELNLSNPEIRSIWYQAFKHGKYPDDMEQIE
jgi:putative intracellular protease/amidase